MNDLDYARRAAELLAQSPIPEAPPADSDVERADIEAMEGALRTEPRRRLAPAFTWGALAAAVLIALGAAVLLGRPSGLHRASVIASPLSVGTFAAPGEQPRRLTGGTALPQASRVMTPFGGTASLDFSTGTRVELAEGSELSLDALGERQRLHVASGRIAAHVAHVAPGGAFVVETRDAEVEVKGTRFSVEVVPAGVRCAVAASTRVKVEEGVVVVRFEGHETTLRAGEHWPKDCLGAQGEAVPSPAPPPGSSLAAQNDLFAQAVTLKRQNDAAGAVSLFEHLMEAWPNGPLAESAEVERMKLLGSVSAERGAEAARAYLARFPRGFARGEAAALAQKAK